MKAICGNPTLPFKMEIKLVYTEGDVRKDTKKKKKMSRRTKLQPVSTFHNGTQKSFPHISQFDCGL